ncbi:MAG: NifB/NifX family molybdenum-iron cluster-binding protein [Halodesulfovibrio sp.]
MKIAIPSRQGLLDEHFGHCEAFTILTLDETRKIVKEDLLTPPPGCGCKSNIVSTLAEMGVKVLLAGNMGQGAVNKLEEAGISVIRGASGSVRAVADQWLAGNLQSSNTICTAHHDHDGHGGCGNH